MDNKLFISLENLLRLPGSNRVANDASILTCGCIVSEQQFLLNGVSTCQICQKTNVSILSEIGPLRDLYQILQQQSQSNRRRSSSKRSIKSSNIDDHESTDLMGLFYKFAKEEQIDHGSKIDPTDIKNPVSEPPSIKSLSLSPTNYKLENKPHSSSVENQFEKNLFESLNEQKEYNFSKCYPFHRQLITFPTNQLKFNFPIPFTGNTIKKAICSSIYSFLNLQNALEVTRFVIINEKRWELYEYAVPTSDTRSSVKPKLICCGKSTGEYGESLNNLTFSIDNEIIIRNDFNKNDKDSKIDLKEVLSNYDQMYCKLTKNFLVISGTKGVMRVFNIDPESTEYKLGQPIYTYLTNFPIRCIAISPNESLIACGITAKERMSNLEQPFVILHRLVFNNKLENVDPITITIPYRDPIKIINFNSTSSHLIIATTWESRYLIIKLKTDNNYRKPRLIWSEIVYTKEFENNNETNLMMSNESITDVQFGNQYSNTVIITSCSLKKTPPIIIRLDGASIDENDSIENHHEDYHLKSSEIISRFSEIGSLIHKVAISPRNDGLILLDKDGKLYLISSPNFNKYQKKFIVLLGEVANSERFSESASVIFSPDGGKVFTIDRKCNFQVFDFTKGIPGDDPNVVKCKIINV
ncbi:unnamed protein product [Candida verbasci]|uniref:SPS-sensor component PTR3 n=1 Tax=Candida verbasci TaxID=1227364 RepID=A0A9W4TYU5_9ASCO|nr:unnamed protein product [Candida verbasci]